jgi:hypothetical protein
LTFSKGKYESYFLKVVSALVLLRFIGHDIEMRKRQKIVRGFLSVLFQQWRMLICQNEDRASSLVFFTSLWRGGGAEGGGAFLVKNFRLG